MFATRNILLPLVLAICLASCTSAGRKSEGRAARQRYPEVRPKPEEQPEQEKEISGKLDQLIEKYWGADYRMGAEGPSQFDCSGFIRRIFSEAYHYTLPRSSGEQFEVGQAVSKTALKYADLVFFTTNGHKTVSHVGVYIGNGKFAHASTSVGVTITALESDYYQKRYLGARRVFR